MSFSSSGKRFFRKTTSFQHILAPQPYRSMENTAYSSSPFELPSHTSLWKTEHILAHQPYRSMEHIAYSSSPAIQVYGKRSIFHALDHLNNIKHDKTAQQERQPCRFPRAGSILSAKKNIFVSYFPVPNHSLKNTHMLWKTQHIRLTSDKFPWKTQHISHHQPQGTMENVAYFTPCAT